MRRLALAVQLMWCTSCATLRVTIEDPHLGLAPGQRAECTYIASPVIPFINTDWLWGSHTPHYVYVSTAVEQREGSATFTVPLQKGLYRLSEAHLSKWSIALEKESSSPYPAHQDGSTLTAVSSTVSEFGPYVKLGPEAVGAIADVRLVTDPRPMARQRPEACVQYSLRTPFPSNWPARRADDAAFFANSTLWVGEPGSLRLPLVIDASGGEVSVVFVRAAALSEADASPVVLTQRWLELAAKGTRWPSHHEGDVLVVDVPKVPTEQGFVLFATLGDNPHFTGLCAMKLVTQQAPVR